MKNTKVITTQKKAETIKTDLLVYCLTENKRKKSPPECDQSIKEFVKSAFDLGDFQGKASQELLIYPDLKSKIYKLHALRILLVGMGKIDSKSEIDVLCDQLRELGGKVAKVCEKTKAQTVTISVPIVDLLGPEKTTQCLAEGLLLGDYRFTKYKKTKKKDTDYTGLKTIQFVADRSAGAIRKGAKMGSVFANAACEARDMANEPGNGWTSKEFAEFAKSLAKIYDFKFTCIEKKEMIKLGMGGILAVNQGSSIPPRMVILEYTPPKKSETILLVGKGITFDSGGISIKPAAGMEEMKYDMCGGAAVLSAMQAIGEIKPNTRVVAIVPATDNMSGSSAVRPGDIIKHFNGVTSEIVNTDAEGRMILGDALSYGIQTYKPNAVVDIATLTGAVIIGLGHHHTGLISNHKNFAKLLISAGKDTGEPIWQLPLTTDYKKQIKSDVADIKNMGGRPGGTITAAAYLSNFVGNTPWAHLDIAGTAWNYTKKAYVPKGPSGIGVRTFINLICNWKNGRIK